MGSRAGGSRWPVRNSDGFDSGELLEWREIDHRFDIRAGFRGEQFRYCQVLSQVEI